MGVNQTWVGLEDGYEPDTGGRWVSTRLGWEMGVNQTQLGDGCQPDTGGRWVSTRHGWEMGVNQTRVGDGCQPDCAGCQNGCQLWMGRGCVKQILTRYTGFSPGSLEWVLGALDMASRLIRPH